LELGDGLTSGFTGSGAFIPRAYSALGKRRRKLGPFLDAVIENKVMSHDAMVDAQLSDLRPPAQAFQRHYSYSLPRDVLAAVGRGPCVLKLADRQRGCGVVAVNPGDIEKTLQALLEVPEPPMEESSSSLPSDAAGSGEIMVHWAEQAREAAALHGLKEQVRHWQADECPSFIAEGLCRSKLVKGSDGRLYDGTLRVGFSLEGETVRLLGSYWKLPDAAADDTKVDLSTRIVSHTHGGSGTRACAAEDEKAVWTILEPALLKIFCANIMHLTVPGLLERYEHDNMLLIVALTRVAAGRIETDVGEAEKLLLLVEQMVQDYEDAPGNGVISYVKRTRGTLAARQKGGNPDWQAGASFYQEAVAKMPTNAAASYLSGMAYLNKGNYLKAGELFAQSVTADCDFACAYNQLATVCLLMGDSFSCLEICEAMLARHDRIAAGHHQIAVALYNQEAEANAKGRVNASRRSKAAACLKRAKELQRGKSWGLEEDDMLEALEKDAPLAKRKVRTWLFHAWRL